MKVLGIESSCDETAAAVVEDGKRILSNTIYSQIRLHRDFGGVVPELASREHIKRIDGVVTVALEEAGCSVEEIDGLAVTRGPGLIGSLLVGISFAKAYSLAVGKPLVGVNHLFSHLYAPELTGEILYPALGLIVSGGHTSLSAADGVLKYRRLARTRDDAAGEILDKVSKELRLGYPGGPVIERLASTGDPKRYPFTFPRFRDGSLDFSFSGLKSAALRIAVEEGERLKREDFAASFQNAIVEYMVEKLVIFIDQAAREGRPYRSLLLGGGVARNRRLRERVLEEGERRSLPVFLPEGDLCTDNGAMIAGLGFHYLTAGILYPYAAPPYSRYEPKGYQGEC